MFFFSFHEIKDDFKKMHYSVEDRLVFGQDAQSESLKALICISESIAKNDPLVWLALM